MIAPPTEEPPPGERRTPPGLFWYRGALRIRRAGLIFNLRRLTCPEGHRFDVHGRVSAGGLQCEHRAYAGAERCGAWLYLLLISSDAAEHRRRRFWAADVTLEEIAAAEERHLAPEEIVVEFGGAFPIAATGPERRL
jgi:hypothetical protein